MGTEMANPDPRREGSYLQRFGRRMALLAAAAVLAGLPVTPSHGLETRAFAFSEFHTAMYSRDGDCPDGLNPDVEAFYLLALRDLGLSASAAKDLFKREFRGGTDSTVEFRMRMTMRGRVNGVPVNVYENPHSVPDTNPLHLVKGRHAYGFNLDGKGADASDAFEDPETQERGVDNNLNKAIGCTVAHRALPPDRPSYQHLIWDNLRESMPAWLITISGENLSRDGDVTVTFDRSLDHVMRNAVGGVLPDMTLRIDPSPRSHSVFKGRIKDQVVSIDPGEFRMVSDTNFYTEFQLRQTHLRLKLNPDGTARGIIGGYTPWQNFYWTFANGHYAVETCCSMDMPRLYHALKRNADAYPDPATGQNMFISAAYALEAVPVLTLRAPPAAPLSYVGR